MKVNLNEQLYTFEGVPYKDIITDEQDLEYFNKNGGFPVIGYKTVTVGTWLLKALNNPEKDTGKFDEQEAKEKIELFLKIRKDFPEVDFTSDEITLLKKTLKRICVTECSTQLFLILEGKENILKPVINK